MFEARYRELVKLAIAPNPAMDVAKSVRQGFKDKLKRGPAAIGSVHANVATGFQNVRPPRVNVPSVTPMMPSQGSMP